MEQTKIWEYFQNEDSSSFDGSYTRLSYLVKKFNPTEKVLNIGVGGAIFEQLGYRYGLEIYSLDPSEQAIRKVQNLIGEERAKVGYSQEIPFGDNYFDGVVMSEVLEHLNDETIKQTLQEVKRVLKSNGKFIGTVPYQENLSEQLVVCPKCGDKFHRWGHVQTFTEKQLQFILIQEFNNAYCKKIRYMNTNPFTLKGKILKPIHDVLVFLGLKSKGLNIYFQASQKSII